MSITKIITVWQPWASLIAIGAKPYEFRGWPAPDHVVGQRIGIHAGARPMRPKEIAGIIEQINGDAPWETGLIREPALALLERLLREPDIIPRSAIVCMAVLGRAVTTYDILCEFGGPVNDSTRNEHSAFAWPMQDVQPLRPPVEARGAQGFWNYEGAL